MDNKSGAQLFEELISKIPSYIRRLTKKQVQIANAVRFYLHSQSLQQVDLAKKMGVSEARISKILAGGENLTLKTISLIEDNLGEDILVIKDPTCQYVHKDTWDCENITLFIPNNMLERKPAVPDEKYDSLYKFVLNTEEIDGVRLAQ